MMEIEDDTKEPGTIIQEIQKGFTIKDRLLRPSLVGVAKKTQEKAAKTEETKEKSETKLWPEQLVELKITHIWRI